MNWKRILTWIVFFVAFLYLFNAYQRGKQSEQAPVSGGPVIVSLSKDNYSLGQEVILKIKNNGTEDLVLKLNCPSNPFSVYRQTSDTENPWELIGAETKASCDGREETTVLAGKTGLVSYSYWDHSLFGTVGTYRIDVPVKDADGKETVYSSPAFSVQEKGIFKSFWGTAFYEPILNLLVFLISIIPGKSLGLAIIILTIIIRLILLIPSQRAMESQKRMQEMQPKLDALKKKYEGNQQRISQETMELWKKEKVNPFGSCLPLIIQFPVLIALYYSVRNGLNPDNSYLLYGSLKSFDFNSIHSLFLGILELTKINVFVLPLIVGILQYIQMKMAMARKKKPQDAPQKGTEMQMATNMMTYLMPPMIALFTASVPAAVGLYWGISTLVGIGQQAYVNVKAKRAEN